MMKFICITMVFMFSFSMGTIQAQTEEEKKINVNFENIPLDSVFKSLSKTTGYTFHFTNDLFVQASSVNYAARNQSLQDLLYSILTPQHYSFDIKGTVVEITKSGTSNQPQTAVTDSDSIKLFKSTTAIRGRLSDIKGDPIPGATVKVKNASKVAITNSEGIFELKDIADFDELVFTSLGFIDKSMAFGNISDPSIVLTMDGRHKELEDVTVNTGVFTRNKNTFTGATSSFTGDQIRNIGVQNVVQSLKSLDPSFIQIANSMDGSNPNVLANVQIRGGSSVATSINSNTLNSTFQSDPNLPLFVLNGIESTLKQITDLDINRIASVTILKDASSTVLYGNKAANGVVVVETVKPTPGKLNLSYTLDGIYSWPDLGSYNFMNSKELFDFQNQAGIYYLNNDILNSGEYYSNLINYQYVLPYVDSLYNYTHARVLAGVDNQWMKFPLRNALTHGHSLNINGGDAAFQYNIHLNYRTQPGVVKGDGKQNFGAGIDLQYTYKKLNVVNYFSASAEKSNLSPYGNYSNYAYMSPFFDIFSEDGGLNKQRYLFDLGSAIGEDRGFLNFVLSNRIPNPLYNATLSSFNNNNGKGLVNNLNILYDITPDLRLQTVFGLTINDNTSVNYLDPRNTAFDDAAPALKGRYSKSWSSQKAYQGSAGLSYHKVLNRHSLNANLRTGVDYSKGETTSMVAVGFPVVPKFNLLNAASYQPDAAPGYYEYISSNIQNVISLNYAYDQRFLFDFSLNRDGTSSFGSEKLYKNFTSVGVGWNIANENFLKEAKDKITVLRLTANVGTSGNQNLGEYTSNTVYELQQGSNVFGIGNQLTQLGTPSLDWQTTRQTNIGLSFDIFKHLFSGYVNYYTKLTDPLIINSSLPPSAGIYTNPLNVGKMELKGLEFALNVSPVYKPSKNLSWTIGLTGGLTRGKYKDINNKLAYQNEKNIDAGIGNETSSSGLAPQLVDVSTLLQYQDGNDPNALWVVPSLGVDPVSGMELFLSKDGKSTFNYNAGDAVNVGSRLPKLQGVLSNTLQIGNFSFSAFFRYSINAMAINTGLYNFAESVNYPRLLANFDKRASQRWLHPGDVAPFSSVLAAINSWYFPLSSRFVSKESFFSGESFNIGYQIVNPDSRLLKAIGAKSLRFNVYMNDIFYLSNVKLERGINYPYAKSISFSTSVSF